MPFIGFDVWTKFCDGIFFYLLWDIKSVYIWKLVVILGKSLRCIPSLSSPCSPLSGIGLSYKYRLLEAARNKNNSLSIFHCFCFFLGEEGRVVNGCQSPPCYPLSEIGLSWQCTVNFFFFIPFPFSLARIGNMGQSVSKQTW